MINKQTLSEISLYYGEVKMPEAWHRSEEHTSELQSRLHLVCRLLLEKKKKERDKKKNKKNLASTPKESTPSHQHCSHNHAHQMLARPHHHKKR